MDEKVKIDKLFNALGAPNQDVAYFARIRRLIKEASYTAHTLYGDRKGYEAACHFVQGLHALLPAEAAKADLLKDEGMITNNSQAFEIDNDELIDADDETF